MSLSPARPAESTDSADFAAASAHRAVAARKTLAATATLGAINLQDIVVQPESTPYNSVSSVTHQTIVVLDFGSQFTQLIARRLRELSIYSEILPFDTPVAKISARSPVGVILSGGPKSVREDGAPRCDPAVFDLSVPVLGICYGMQLMTDALGGEVAPAPHREFGLATIRIEPDAPLLASWVAEQVARASCASGPVTATSSNQHRRALPSRRPAAMHRSPQWRLRIATCTRSCSIRKWRIRITAPRFCAASRTTSAAV